MFTNYHTHTVFCDGKDTPEAMVRAAIDAGMDVIGLSAHAIWPFSSTWHLPCKQYGGYLAEVERLKQAYASSITVLSGFEADYLPPLSTPDKSRYAGFKVDYLIGSVHYAAGGAFEVDDSAEKVAAGIQTFYHGDGKRFVQDYFESVRAMLRARGFDIAGHLDVIRKRNGVLRFFDETEDWYIEEIEETARAASESGVIVEINTGGIARGAIDDVYPSADFLAALHRQGVPVMINSDAHAAKDIACAFDRARAAALKAGYTETAYLLGGKRLFTDSLSDSLHRKAE